MTNRILRGVGREIHSTPEDAFQAAMMALPEHMASRLAFMTREHHAVRDFVVRELPRQQQPLTPARIAQTLGPSAPRVTALLAELERNLFFLVRDAEGNVSWAFPVTTTPTPHRLTFSTGEKIFGA